MNLKTLKIQLNKAQIIQGEERQEKLDTILIAAQKRFGIYGLKKTTMRELAQDLGISKASLYYYFPDKMELFKAVIAHEQHTFITLLEKKIGSNENPDDLLRYFAKVRNAYFKEFLNLSKIRSDSFQSLKPYLKETYHELHSKETEIIEEILKKGNQLNIYFVNDTKEMALLFLDLMQSMRWMAFKNKAPEMREQSDFDSLEIRMNLFLNLFLKGISNPKTN